VLVVLMLDNPHNIHVAVVDRLIRNVPTAWLSLQYVIV
jgi:hypothetical protein